MTEKTEKNINDINAAMRLEGMPLTVDDKDMLRKCLEGESSFDEERGKIFQEIRQLNE
ncbi:MAG: hypothetical protein RSC10_09105 [Longicatena sp.]